MKKVICTHSRETSTYIDTFINDWGDTEDGHWVYSTENTTEDIDLHRYRCYQCNEVLYYSGAARRYYEEGKKSDVQGLDR